MITPRLIGLIGGVVLVIVIGILAFGQSSTLNNVVLAVDAGLVTGEDSLTTQQLTEALDGQNIQLREVRMQVHDVEFGKWTTIGELGVVDSYDTRARQQEYQQLLDSTAKTAREYSKENVSQLAKLSSVARLLKKNHEAGTETVLVMFGAKKYSETGEIDSALQADIEMMRAYSEHVQLIWAIAEVDPTARKVFEALTHNDSSSWSRVVDNSTQPNLEFIGDASIRSLILMNCRTLSDEHANRLDEVVATYVEDCALTHVVDRDGVHNQQGSNSSVVDDLAEYMLHTKTAEAVDVCEMMTQLSELLQENETNDVTVVWTTPYRGPTREEAKLPCYADGSAFGELEGAEQVKHVVLSDGRFSKVQESFVNFLSKHFENVEVVSVEVPNA